MKIRNLATSLAIAFAVMFGVAATATPAYAASPTDSATKQVCAGVSGVAGGSCGSGAKNLNSIIALALNVLSAIAGIVAVIMIIVAGLKFITSGGDASAVATAKKSLIYAIIGLAVVALSQVIVHYVLYNLEK
jgi:hypothetical protein